MTISLAITSFGMTTINDMQVIAFQLVDPYFGKDIVYIEVTNEMKFSISSQRKNYNDDATEFPHVLFEIRGIIDTEEGIKLLQIRK